MSLILKVLSYKGGPPQGALSCTLDEEGGSVGRSPGNRFILPDPERFVSRHHGNIAFRDGAYHYTDTSTAGSYLSNRHLLLQHKAVVLTDGDVLRIGEYEIAVSVTPDALTQAGTPPLDFDPFGAESASPLAAAPESPLWSEPSPEAWPAPLEPFPSHSKPAMPTEASFLDQPDVSPFHESFLPPKPVGGNSGEPVPPDFDVGDLLRDLDWHDSGPEPRQPSASWEPPEDFFKDLIPDALEPEPLRPDFPNSPTLAEPEPLPEKRIASLGESRTAGKRHATELSPEPKAVEPMPVEPARSAPSRPEFAGLAPDAAPLAAGGRDLFECFLEGAGLASCDWVKDEELPEVMTMAGALLRDFVAGMMTVLRARSEMKSQFRVLVTTLRAQENNPLKFTVTADDALRLMLARDHPGFIDPIKAVRGGFGDIMNHQMAMNAGIQAALVTALKRFDPQSFEKLHEDAFIQKKAKCWEAFCKAYPGLVNDVMENFFGEEFADVYEWQMHRLRSAEPQ
jgi:type VI secretion system protein